jgi:hypothetical protein
METDDGFDTPDVFGSGDPWLEMLQPCTTLQPYHIHTHTVDVAAYTCDLVLLVCARIPEARHAYVLQHFLLHLNGKRRVVKSDVGLSDLSAAEYAVYAHTRQKYSDPARVARVAGFLRGQGRTKRLMNYFVVHYISHYSVSYYLDRGSYPVKIVGTLNDYDDATVLHRISVNEPISWVNLHHEYMLSKHRFGQRRLHAPYARSVSVGRSDALEGYSLCELNFYLWLDEIGGLCAFTQCENDVIAKKKVFDRKRREASRARRVMDHTLSTCNAQCQSFLVQGPRPIPYTPIFAHGDL